MRPTIEQIKAAIQNESSLHGIVMESCRIDIPPVITIPGRTMMFEHSVDCLCGHKYELRTQHSGNTQAGGAEFYGVLQAEVLDHALTANATMIYRMHEPTH
jgi:hypothetical protein